MDILKSVKNIRSVFGESQECENSFKSNYYT